MFAKYTVTVFALGMTKLGRCCTVSWGGTPLFGLYGDVPLDRVWLFGLAFLNRVYNLTWLCPKEGQNLS